MTFAIVVAFAATQSEPESFPGTPSPRLGGARHPAAFPSRREKPLASWPAPPPGDLQVARSPNCLVTGPRHALRSAWTGLPVRAVSRKPPSAVQSAIDRDARPAHVTGPATPRGAFPGR